MTLRTTGRTSTTTTPTTLQASSCLAQIQTSRPWQQATGRKRTEGQMLELILRFSESAFGYNASTIVSAVTPAGLGIWFSGVLLNKLSEVMHDADKSQHPFWKHKINGFCKEEADNFINKFGIHSITRGITMVDENDYSEVIAMIPSISEWRRLRLCNGISAIIG